MEHQCLMSETIIFQAVKKNGGVNMKNILASFVSYTFAAISGICLVGGLAVLSCGKER